jgi:hypothetical protein
MVFSGLGAQWRIYQMVYWDGQRYVSRTPTLVPDIRAHIRNWVQFKKTANAWPILSITTYVMRYTILVSGVIFVLWYTVRRDLTKGQGFLILLAVVLPVLFMWFMVERAAWNRDLRRKGISRDPEIWGVTQFPQE